MASHSGRHTAIDAKPQAIYKERAQTHDLCAGTALGMLQAHAGWPMRKLGEVPEKHRPDMEQPDAVRRHPSPQVNMQQQEAPARGPPDSTNNRIRRSPRMTGSPWIWIGVGRLIPLLLSCLRMASGKRMSSNANSGGGRALPSQMM